MNAPLNLKAQFPRKLSVLLEERARYKVLYGGRGAGRSWGIIRALLIRGISEPGLRVLCAREVQSSMRDSVHQLIRDQIIAMGLQRFYKVLESEIRGPGGTLFTFKGLRDPEALKSTEGVDVVFLEEARTVTKTSWEKLDPTIRKEGSEIWIAFNPELETDFIYQLFVKNAPPPRSIVQKVSWQDNPWFPQVLREQMEHMRREDYDNYLHIWEGHCRFALEGAVYANELRAATREDRISRFSHQIGRPVHTFWDLGHHDQTAIWFVQLIGLQVRLLRFYQKSAQQLGHFLQLLETLQRDHGYVYGTHWLPHDADHRILGMPRTRRQQFEDAGHKVRIVPSLGAGGVAEGINAARTMFANCWFHEIDTAEGVDCLRHYHFGVREDGSRSINPVHDWSSDAADGFRMIAVALREEKAKVKPNPPSTSIVAPGPRSWMAR